ncbi:hypothetical protein JK636_09285 [Clostridium sp. YIM B02515]|uniref:Uncharacterized protein n=1 Tax=Clostridium rhizosphaerae TaxID=2803861 RepID=A0ABS1TA28_9CLOT|nr:hypothetical protein [Clostridium rhizosphaerae]MBL4935952.1 hypothetical protein [Clostridium rhizosphaerae]
MSIKDMAEKIKGTVIPNDVKKEDFEVTEDEKKEITESNKAENEDRPISDEVEDINNNEDNQNEEPIKIKTMFVKEEDQKTEETSKDKIKGAAKIAAGVGIAVIGLAAVILKSKRKR